MTTSRWEWNDKVKGYTRPDTLDEYVFKEIKPSYNCLELGEGDIVLDIGANIGAFSKYAMEKGAYVYAYEPEPENYELLVVNTHPDSLSTRGGWIKRMQSAVVVGMHKNMLGQGFSVIKEPKLTGGNWTTVAGYSR